MNDLDDRMNAALGGAYRDRFGAAPAVLPEPARRHVVPIAAGCAAAVVAAAVAVPLAITHTGSGTTATPAAHRAAVLLTGSPTAAGNQVCGPDDVKLTAYLNQRSVPVSVIEQKDPNMTMTTFVGYGILTGTSATPCRLYDESESVGFVAPSGEYLGFNGLECGYGVSVQRNRTGPAPTADPLAAAPCGPDVETPDKIAASLRAREAAASALPMRIVASNGTGAPSVPTPAGTTEAVGTTPAVAAPTSPLPVSTAAATAAVSAPAVAVASPAPTAAVVPDPAVYADYGVLIGSAGTIDAPADGLGDGDDPAFGVQVAALHAGKGPSPEPVYRQQLDDYVNNPYLIPKDKVETGRWLMRITFGNLTVDTPFQVTAG